MEGPGQAIFGNFPTFGWGGDRIKIFIQVDQLVLEQITHAEALVDADLKIEGDMVSRNITSFGKDLHIIGRGILRQLLPINGHISLIAFSGRLLFRSRLFLSGRLFLTGRFRGGGHHFFYLNYCGDFNLNGFLNNDFFFDHHGLFNHLGFCCPGAGRQQQAKDAGDDDPSVLKDTSHDFLLS